MRSQSILLAARTIEEERRRSARTILRHRGREGRGREKERERGRGRSEIQVDRKRELYTAIEELPYFKDYFIREKEKGSALHRKIIINHLLIL